MENHLNFRVWNYDLKKMVRVTDIDFRTRVVTYEGLPDGDHPSSPLMEDTLLRGKLGCEIWESDIVLYLGIKYRVEWYFQRWILRNIATGTIKEITATALKSYQVIGDLYGG